MEIKTGDEKSHDLVVIGTGNAGTAMALEARRAGWEVAIADELPYGGTCSVKGCLPKKVLVGAAEVVERAKAMEERGIAGDFRIVWPDLIRFKHTFTDPVPETKRASYAKAGIEQYRGHARFLGRNTLQIGEEVLSARFIGISTGAVPLPLGIQGEDLVSTSDDFLAMETLPERIVFIGGGFISFELGNVAARAGAKVTILQRSGRVLKEFDPFLVDVLVDALKSNGLEILTDMPVISVKKQMNHLLVHTDKGRTFETDMVVHGAGRGPNLAGLDLEKGGVAVDDRGIAVNKYLQSISNPSVYVAGDANARGKPLSPVAKMEGRAAGRNMIHGNTIAPDYLAVPSVVFASPLLASVGLREDQAAKLGMKMIVHRQETPDWYSTRRVGIARSGYNILTEGPSGRILGAHLLGYNADEVINLFALAIKAGITLADLQEIAWAYPTGGFDINRIT